MAHQAVKIIAGPWGSYNEKEIIDADTPADVISAWLADGAIIEVPDGAVVKLDDGALVQAPGVATEVVPQPDGTVVRASDGVKIDAVGAPAQERFQSVVVATGPMTGTEEPKDGWKPTTGTVAPTVVTSPDPGVVVPATPIVVTQAHQPATPAPAAVEPAK
jgi:hypothetical protein